VQDIPAFEAGLSNRVSPGDLTVLMAAIDQDRAASPKACAEMRRILLAQEHNDMIPANLPSEAKVAHKTGAIEGVRHDTGIVYAPFATYYLTLLCDQLKDDPAGAKAVAELSRFIYDQRESL